MRADSAVAEWTLTFSAPVTSAFLFLVAVCQLVKAVTNWITIVGWSILTSLSLLVILGTEYIEEAMGLSGFPWLGVHTFVWYMITGAAILHVTNRSRLSDF